MKLNGLTNNLKGNDQSLSNSYLQHIVEMLRKEVEALSAKESALESEVTEHIEGQKTLVSTEVVRANEVNAPVVNTSTLKNGATEIDILLEAIEMFGRVKVNGKDVLTEEAFEGPFTYRGVTDTLPEDPSAGDTYIMEDTVYVWNGTSWDNFILPVGTISRPEYEQDKADILTDISTLQTGLRDTNLDVGALRTALNESVAEIGVEIGQINNDLSNKVDKNLEDDKAYVRKNDAWIEMESAQNAVAHTAGESMIDNSEEDGVTITSPKVNITSEDIKVNGKALTEADRFSLSKTNATGATDTYYELYYRRSPYSPVSSRCYGYTIYDDGSRFCIKTTMNQKYTVTTKDYQYRKTCDQYRWADDNKTTLTSMNKDGQIKEMYFPSRNLVDSQGRNHIMDWLTWNPEFCPDGFENKVYLFMPWMYDTASNKAALFEYDNGEFKASYDLTDQMIAQGATLQTSLISNWDQHGEGGKSLRNKNIQRICWISHNVKDGGNYAVILGGGPDSDVNDPFDPSKCIYISLPAVANPGYTSMAATDKAWYLTEYNTGRIMRITPNGRVTEYNLLSTSYKSSTADYIEYTDKNGRPACAFHLFVDASNGKSSMIFFEEREDGGVNFEEVDMSPYVYTGWDSANWRMMENDYYIFFTAGYGFSYNGENSFPAAADAKKLIYFDKQSHTVHIIDDFYGIAASDWAHSYMGMYKTREKAIWVVPHIQTLTAAQRTGELKYITNTDYTEIDEETGKDLGSIEVQTASIGANHPWFTCNNDFGWNNYAVMFHDTSSWGYTSIWAQYACVNDDGIGFLMSPDYKAFALFYGEGNVQVYEIDSEDTKNYRYNPNVQQMQPAELDNQKTCLASCEGLQHGWLIRARGYTNARGFYGMDYTNGLMVYIGIKYHNGEPTILERPNIKILRDQNDEYARPKHMYDFYSYLLTYDDYERRKKIMRGTFMEIAYGWPTHGIDGYYKEVEHNSNDKLNLNYDGQVISSVNL